MWVKGLVGIIKVGGIVGTVQVKESLEMPLKSPSKCKSISCACMCVCVQVFSCEATDRGVGAQGEPPAGR